MADFRIVNVPDLLNQKITTYDEAGNIVPDDGSYQRQGAETQYVLAEFLRDKGLLLPGTDVTRRPDLVVMFSQLTEQGQAFARFAVHKWTVSTDRLPVGREINASGLEKRWLKFNLPTA